MAEGGDDESDEEEEEGNGPAKVEGKNEKKLSEEEATLVDDVEITEKGLLIEEELSKFAEDPNFVGADDTCELNVDEHLESSTVAEPESDAEEAAEATLTDLSINTIFTLEDVLKATDFAGYIPKGDDHESRCLKRIRAIVDQTRHFVALVRIKERVLNWPDVLKVKTRAKAHQAYEHAVAKARASFQCSAQRQSRFSLRSDPEKLTMPGTSWQLRAVKQEAILQLRAWAAPNEEVARNGGDRRALGELRLPMAHLRALGLKMLYQTWITLDPPEAANPGCLFALDNE
eukprot:g2243.t1